jgi:hypothetical protein
MLTADEASVLVNEIDNLLGSCSSCNPSKGSVMPGNIPGTWRPSNPTPEAIQKMRELGTWVDY